MKTVLIALCLTLLPLDAYAISRYNSTSMSCAEARGTVLAEGAVILRWRSAHGVQRYGRFVAHDGFCDSGERAEPSYILTQDSRSCPVLECKYYDPDDDFIFRRFRRD